MFFPFFPLLLTLILLVLCLGDRLQISSAMRLSLSLVVAAGVALVEPVLAAKSHPKTKNFIYVVPDGYGIASQTLARDYYSVTGGEGTVERPNAARIGVDSMV